MKHKVLFIALVIPLLWGGLLYAQNKPADKTVTEAKPANTTAKTVESQPVTSTVLSVTISKIEGDAEVKDAGGKEWVKATAGMTLKEGVLVSTGFKSEVVLLFADNSTVVVKQLTQMKITDFEQDKAAIKTDLRLRVGSLEIKVKENQPVKTDMKISTPNATASVRGTQIQEVRASNHFGDRLLVASGRVIYASHAGSMPVRGGEGTTQQMINPITNLIMNTVANITPIGVTNLEALVALSSSSAQGTLLSTQTTSTSDPSLTRIKINATTAIDIYRNWYPVDH